MTPFLWCAVAGCGVLLLSIVLDGLFDGLGLDDIGFDGARGRRPQTPRHRRPAPRWAATRPGADREQGGGGPAPWWAASRTCE